MSSVPHTASCITLTGWSSRGQRAKATGTRATGGACAMPRSTWRPCTAASATSKEFTLGYLRELPFPWNPFWGFLSLDSSCRWVGILLRSWFVWVRFCFGVYLVSIITEQSRSWHLSVAWYFKCSIAFPWPQKGQWARMPIFIHIFNKVWLVLCKST